MVFVADVTFEHVLHHQAAATLFGGAIGHVFGHFAHLVGEGYDIEGHRRAHFH